MCLSTNISFIYLHLIIIYKNKSFYNNMYQSRIIGLKKNITILFVFIIYLGAL